MSDHGEEVPLLPELIPLWQQTLNWQPNPFQQQQFQKLYAAILEGNRRLNLTRITAPSDFWEKHLWDSLRGIRQLLAVDGGDGGEDREDRGGGEESPHTPHPTPHTPFNVIDIGTGAGFPGIPVAIACPHWAVTLLDATRKKIDFLNTLLLNLDLSNTRTIVDRAELIGQNPNHRETYDLALVRAVAGATIGAEYALPLLKIGGLATLYRGQWTEEEFLALQTAVKQLGGTIEQIEGFKTPLTVGDRHCVHLRKVTPTPASFPRATGIPVQKPLGFL